MIPVTLFSVRRLDEVDAALLHLEGRAHGRGRRSVHLLVYTEFEGKDALEMGRSSVEVVKNPEACTRALMLSS